MHLSSSQTITPTSTKVRVSQSVSTVILIQLSGAPFLRHFSCPLSALGTHKLRPFFHNCWLLGCQLVNFFSSMIAGFWPAKKCCIISTTEFVFFVWSSAVGGQFLIYTLNLNYTHTIIFQRVQPPRLCTLLQWPRWWPKLWPNRE